MLAVSTYESMRVEKADGVAGVVGVLHEPLVLLGQFRDRCLKCQLHVRIAPLLAHNCEALLGAGNGVLEVQQNRGDLAESLVASRGLLRLRREWSSHCRPPSGW